MAVLCEEADERTLWWIIRFAFCVVADGDVQYSDYFTPVAIVILDVLVHLKPTASFIDSLNDPLYTMTLLRGHVASHLPSNNPNPELI